MLKIIGSVKIIGKKLAFLKNLLYLIRNKFLIGRDENNKYGAIDLDGNIIVPFCYMNINTNTSNNYFEFYNEDDKILIMNFEGRIYKKKCYS